MYTVTNFKECEKQGFQQLSLLSPQLNAVKKLFLGKMLQKSLKILILTIPFAVVEGCYKFDCLEE